MSVDQTSLDRIRNATFPSARRGYDKHEVEKFLSRLADWLETGGGDQDRSETVKRELERVGERTGAILAQAEESAQQIRAEAEEEAKETMANAKRDSEQARAEADAYAKTTRQEAGYDAEETLEKAVAEARETVEDAEARAHRIVEEGRQRREDIESVIADLVRRRDIVLEDVEALGSELAEAISAHQPEAGADQFAPPDELDPAERGEGGEDEGADFADEDDEGEELEAEAEEPETDDEAEPEAPTKRLRPSSKGTRGGRVQA